MAEYTVYVDELLATNMLMNYAILHLTAKLAGAPYRVFRLLAASFIGSLYVFAVFFPESDYYYNFAGKFLISAVMVLMAFGVESRRRFLTMWVVFYGVSFAVGGVVLGINSLVGRAGGTGGGYWRLWPGVAVALATVVVIGRKGVILRRRVAEGFFRVPVTIHLGAKKLGLEALLDTGNELADPVSKDPVVIVEYEAVKDLLPPELREALTQDWEPDLAKIAGRTEDPGWLTRLRLIPYRSLGKTGGLLLGFKPDAVEVIYGGRAVKTSRVVVGIYRQRLSPEAKYNALLHPRLIKALL
ncbi:MAG TPA: sigma-E processing peptidase SpoIIGA [Desulfotomaculum sp.]|nr:sigma-E processing peptidase SpoIIGA [Desulfotomaculum sp.]